MDNIWKSNYDLQVDKYFEKHFGNVSGITQLFPYMSHDFNWSGKRKVADPRTARKSNLEYHGLERHARQYHVSAMYREAAEFWLMAAAWRRDMMKAQGIDDSGHKKAVKFAIANYKYNMSLHRWQRQKNRYRKLPTPEAFGLDSDILVGKDAIAEIEIAAIRQRSKQRY